MLITALLNFLENREVKAKRFLKIYYELKPFSFIIYFLQVGIHLLSYPLSIVIDFLVSLISTELEICMRDFGSLKLKKLSDEIRAILSDSYSKALQNDETLRAVNELDNVNLSLIEELHIINTLIPEQVIVFSPYQDFSGKTLLGGTIAISADSFSASNSKLSLGIALIVFRHEISNKKWLLIGSGNKYTLSSSIFEENQKPEAGIIF